MKYWYYTYQTSGGLGNGVTTSNNGEFPLIETLEMLKGKLSTMPIIDFYSEVSEHEYTKVNEFITKNYK